MCYHKYNKGKENVIINTTYPKQGQVYLADLGEHRGHIQGGIRPVIITSNNKGNSVSPVVSYVPLTSKTKNNLPVHALIKKGEVKGLKQDSTALAEQLGTINKSNLIEYLGDLNQEQMIRVAKAIAANQSLLVFLLPQQEYMQSLLKYAN